MKGRAAPCRCGAEWWRAAGYCDRCGAEAGDRSARWYDDPARGMMIVWAGYAVAVALILGGV